MASSMALRRALRARVIGRAGAARRLGILILTRRREQTLVIYTSDGPVYVKVLGVERDRVKLGIEAPQACDVLREEVPRDRRRRDSVYSA